MAACILSTHQAKGLVNNSAMDVRSVLHETSSELSKINDGDKLVQVFMNIKKYMDVDEDSAPLKEKAEFKRVHYTPFLRLLVNNMGPRWVDLLTPERLELWDSFFLEGPPDQAFLVLLDSVERTKPSICLDRCVHVLERFLQRGALADLIWEICQQQLEPTPTPVLHEVILGRICSLPDHLANSLQKRNKPLFYPKNYYPRVAGAILRVLRMISDSLREGKGCSISFVSQVMGKVCMQGHQIELLSVLVPHLLTLLKSDCIYQRLSWRLVESVPERWMDALITGILQVARGPADVSKLLGDLVLKNKKVEYLFTQKMLFLQYCVQKEKLQCILGYLSLEKSRRPLMVKVLRELLEVWSSASVVKHSPHAQLLHLSRSILICSSLMNDDEIQSCKEEIKFALVNGTHVYLDNSILNTRRLGMLVSEALSKYLNPEPLHFEYEEDEEIKELKSLLSPPCICPSNVEESVKIPGESSPSNVSPPRNDDVKPEEGSRSASRSDSELDSDDDLVPYDMSEDTELKKSSAPAYIRDCMEVLLSDDLEKVEVTMRALAPLIRANTAASKEVSVELVKMLLHIDQPGIEHFEELRHEALVASTVVDPILASKYLTGEFYSLNYNLRQRMDILDVLASAAKDLSKLVAPTKSVKPKPQPANKSGTPNTAATAATADWKKIVEERIAMKTRRFGKGQSAPEPVSVPNSFHVVAGHFFFPLIQNFDRPVVTFDLLGEDRLVLGKLVHTLACLMHLSTNASVASQMGKALLEFVWVLRFHLDPYVRQGLLFCVSTILLSVPWERLMTDMAEEVIETQRWLADVTERDVDDDCRRIALNGLVLMEKLKKNLHSRNKK
ncbi:telomere length regulation protein TEL2 homolog isoform X1 [Pelobates fuscus]|uniref:telomere length regulation protein TEL2 homolog isoform X1 n=1 Tax=Pelobates fuscus TaxID=191477 RepID=UPI002FE478BF